MARIYPFRALRYNPSLVRVEDCVTQPYDKITPGLQASYYARSPYNLVRVILGLPELFDEPGTNDIYTRAARDFADWQRSGVLVREPEPCLFAYAQRFTIPGTTQVTERRGLIALGAVSPYSEGVVFRHEQTHTRAKTDRLNLLRATRAHFGQIFMLYSDPARSVESLLFPANAGDTAIADINVRDDLGVEHRVWKISDPSIINMVQGALSDKKLIIADGHHRYETALAYAAEHAPPAEAPEDWNGISPLSPSTHLAPPYPEAAVMMTLVNMEDAGLFILPTHRVVRDLPGFDAAGFAESLAGIFTTVTPLGSPAGDGLDAESLQQALNGALEGAHAAAPAGSTVLLAVTRRRAWALTLAPGDRDRLLASAGERRRRLDLVVLHELVLSNLLGITPEAVQAGEHVSYAREASEALTAVQEGGAQIAFLLRPVTLDQLRAVTFAGEVMPQKSTDFYPKLLSGLTIYTLGEPAEPVPGESGPGA